MICEVDLQPGEMLFYESAKCAHGRPRKMKGRWYSSLFMHYAPITWDMSTKVPRDAVCDVPSLALAAVVGRRRS